VMSDARAQSSKRDIKRVPLKKKISRRLKNAQPKVHENVKTAMFVRGSNASQNISQLLTELSMLKKPDSILLKQKKSNVFRPFEDVSGLEFLSSKNDCSLFVLGSHSKKRPNNLVFGRFFDHHILDMIEVGMENFKSMSSFVKASKPTIGSKPCFLFFGEEFSSREDFKSFSSILLDIFRGRVVDELDLSGLEYVIICFSQEQRVFFRVYRLVFKKSGSKIPNVQLEEIGPSIDFTLRRFRSASSEVWKEAIKLPREQMKREDKNISTDMLGKYGVIHIERQDLGELAVKKMRAFRKRKPERENNYLSLEQQQPKQSKKQRK